MITLETKVIPHPDVIATTLPDAEMVLLHLHSHHYYTLNTTGMQIWEELTQDRTLSEIGQVLEARYDITLDQAQQHVIALVEGLAAEQLVQVVGAA